MSLYIKDKVKADSLEAHYLQSANTQDYIQRYFRYLSGILEGLDVIVIEQMIDVFTRMAERGNTLYLMGNGGSAATASHMANDLAFGAWLPDYAPFRVVSLTDNVPIMTAVANDVDYSNLFTYQLRTLLQPNDVVLAMSVSGNSTNILNAIRYAQDNGAVTIGWCGFDGGDLQTLVDICLHIPSNPGEYGPVEDVMMILDHVIHAYFMLSRRRSLKRIPPAVMASLI